MTLPNRRPIWDRHALFESWHYSNINKQNMYKFRLDSAGMSVSDGSSEACQSLMGNVGLRSGMLVPDEACRGLRWVADRAYRSQMVLPIRHIGLRWVSDRSPIVIILSWINYFSSFFFVNFSLSFNVFSNGFQGWKSLQTQQNIMQYAYNIFCIQCWEFKPINDYRIRNGPKWQKSEYDLYGLQS